MGFKYRRSILFILRLLFITGLLGIFLIGWLSSFPEAEFYFWGYVVALISYTVILLVFLSVYGGLKVGSFRLGSLVFSCIIAIVLSNFLVYLELSLIAMEMLGPLDMLLIMAVQCVWAMLCCWTMNRVYYGMRTVRDVVVVYGGDMNDAVTIYKMKSIEEKYRIVKLVEADRPMDEILSKIAPYESVLIGNLEPNKRYELVSRCYRMGKRINIIPSAVDIIMNSAEQTNIFDTPVILCRNTEIGPEQRFIKRAMDVFVSLLGLAITSPVMLVTALLIKCEDRGSVFFRQTRLTLDSKPFKVIKFRSMIEDAEKGLSNEHLLSTEDDPRITKVGKVIRKYRIDELPQLFNILMGDMSLVGPRPERPEIYDLCREELPDFDLRLRAKGGLTGYAQVYGRYNTGLRDKLNMDLFYIETYSILQDIKLILLTFKILFIKESTQGVLERQADEVKAFIDTIKDDD